MANPENKQIPYESTQKDIRDAIESVATAIGGISAPSAEDVSYDNSGSGLSATDVQNAIDEIVSDIPTVNNGTLTIQQNGTSKGSFTANSASNVNVNIETPTADKKTATDQFTTADGGLLSKCQINLVPVQSGSGDPSPDNVRPISGHTEVDLYNVGKNRLIPNLVSETKNGVTLTVHNDGTITLNGLATATTQFYNALTNITKVEIGESYIVSGCPSGGSGTTYSLRPMKTASLYYSDDIGSGSVFTADSTDLFINIIIRNGYNCNNLTFKPMLRKASVTDSTFEPYLGHLYTVQIGSTVYGGYVDLVSGVMNVDRVGQKLQDFVWEYTSAYGGYFSSNQTYVMDDTIPLVSSCYQYGGKNSSNAQMVNLPDFSVIHRSNALPIYNRLRIKDSRYTTSEDLMSAVGNEVVVYALATPFTIQLTPQQIEALPNQNNLSTPLDGQSIETNGVEYKELFTFADVKEYVKPLIPYSNAGSHNAIYRGKCLGNHVTPEQWASIVAGTFDDLFIGDYWTINSVNWRIAHFDYWFGTGDTECTTHHAVIVPDTALYTDKMNSSNVTTGGYYNSEMRGGANYLVSGSSNLYSASETIKSAFGSSHILTHREILTNAVSSGNASGWEWCNSSVDLMNEVMVYGTLAWSVGGKGYEVGDGKGQLALFRHDISKVTNRENWWLHGIHSSATFAFVADNGRANSTNASLSLGVRPCFAIK